MGSQANPLAALAALASLMLIAASAVVGCSGGRPAPMSEIFVAPVEERGSGSEAEPFRSLQDALDRAGPGTTIHVAPGTYGGPFETSAAGAQDRPVRIIGEGSVLVSGPRDHTFSIRHNYVELQGFVVSGGDQLLVIDQASFALVTDNTFQDAGGECVRLKRASDNVITGNRVSGCGRQGFDLAGDRKNGEGIYVGTTPDQVGKSGPDKSARNQVSNNRIASPAECVDVKEGALANAITGNDCSGVLDPKSGGFSVRGNHNTLADNRVHDVAGAGVRLGGVGTSDGIANVVRGNDIRDVGGVGVKAERVQQGAICGNVVERAAGGISNTRQVDPTRPC